MTVKAATPAKKRVRTTSVTTTRVRTTKPKATRRSPNHGEISERAYYIFLEEGGSDERENWLRAERELMAA